MRCLAAETHGRWCRDIAARDSGILREHQCQHLFIGVSGAGKGIEYEVRCTAQRVISQTDNSKTEGDGEHAEGVARSSSCDCTHDTGEKSERGGDVKNDCTDKENLRQHRFFVFGIHVRKSLAHRYNSISLMLSLIPAFTRLAKCSR